jgi:hypothetical protein
MYWEGAVTLIDSLKPRSVGKGVEHLAMRLVFLAEFLDNRYEVP